MTTTSNAFDPETFLAHARASLSAPLAPKLPFGIPALDDALCGGIAAGALAVLVAPPRHFTTTFLIDACCRWAAAGQKVLFITASTAKETFARLSAHQQFQVTNKVHPAIKHQPVEQDIAVIASLAGLVKVVSFADSGAAMESALAAAIEEPSAVVLLDGVEREELRGLRQFARDYKIRVVAAHTLLPHGHYQLHGPFENPDARAMDFADEGGVGYAASVVLALQRVEDSSQADMQYRSMRLHLAAAREGGEPVTIPMFVIPGSCRFVEDKREVSP